MSNQLPTYVENGSVRFHLIVTEKTYRPVTRFTSEWTENWQMTISVAGRMNLHNLLRELATIVLSSDNMIGEYRVEYVASGRVNHINGITGRDYLGEYSRA